MIGLAIALGVVVFIFDIVVIVHGVRHHKELDPDPWKPQPKRKQRAT